MLRTTTLTLLLLSLSLGAAENSPGFLASRHAVDVKSLPAEWNATRNVAWKADVPGTGWSSPVVWGSRVFVTTCVSGDKQAEPRKGLYIQDLQGKVPPGEHDWRVVCLDAKTGKTLWDKSAFQGQLGSTIHLKNSLASETPVTDGKHVWAYFGNVGIACFDVGGNLAWEQKTPVHKTKMGWGTGSSLALHDGKLLYVHDNEEKSFLAALDAKTGKALWRVDRKEGSNWGTPFVWKNSKRAELVTAGTDRTRSYDLDGKLLWELKGMSILSIPTPFAVGDTLYVSSGYVMDLKQKPVYSIKPGAKGDISLASGKTSNDFINWVQWHAGSYHPTPIVDGEYLYVLLDRGYLSCYEAKTGKEVYKNRRIGGGASAFTASPVAIDGKLYCLSEEGDTFVLQGGPEFKFLARNPLGDMALASPTIAGGSLFVRTKSKLYCLRQEGK